ncbi:MAG: FadR/GntR family transcriptional regulator [Desulfuromonadales bacterium]|nr:FadR/GntR family transcriptional regulator [Desulfuromonadales bacterium]
MFVLPEGLLVNKRNITEYLVRQIVSGKLKHNTVLPNEISFAAQFGVSRTMIRDVLKSLEGKGLIERKTNVGTRVRSIHSWNLLDQELLDWSRGILTQSRFLLSLMELRLIIEPQAAALAAVRANDEDLLKIRGDYARMGADMEKDENAPLDTEADIDFHKSVIKACGNLFLSQFGGAIQGALHHTIYLSNKVQIDHKASLGCHRRVVDAIENRDPQKAYSAMCCVLNNAIKDLNLKISGVIISEFDS